MPAAHDPETGKPDPASAPGPDPLSDVLRTVKLEGALFFLVDATDPWCVDVPAAAEFARILLPRARHVVSYHIAVEGCGLASVPGAEPVRFGAGDVIVFPHADPYVMASAAGVTPELDRAETLQFFRDLAAGRLPFVIPEGGGGTPRAKFLCGFLGCDLRPGNPLFSALPRLLHIRRARDAPPDLLDRLVALAMAELRTGRAGGESIRLGLTELMFVEALRRHLETALPVQPNWLAGLRDPVAGRALALLHADPARGWTLAALARACGASRSVLAERFAAHVGQTPMQYLGGWRMELAARRLADSDDGLATVAERVGFASEAGFSRAFKRATGLSPGQWRRGRRDPR